MTNTSVNLSSTDNILTTTIIKSKSQMNQFSWKLRINLIRITHLLRYEY